MPFDVRFSWPCWLWLVVGLRVITNSTAVQAADALHWSTNYTAATESAQEQGKYLLIYFSADGELRAADASLLASQNRISRALQNFELVRLPLDAAIRINGRLVALLEHPAFAEMQRSPGIAVLDYAHPGTTHYGHVVSMFPLSAVRSLDERTWTTILTLPKGTLTQRTMIYAVRMHPERPASTKGALDPVLVEEAESHSHHQAHIRVQGHHRWGSRFQRILGRLGFRAASSAPVEVVAESWPGQSLVEAAEDCVHSWRQSPGHWNQVRSDHAAYGYDMKRGANGIWYATGIFAGFRR